MLGLFKDDLERPSEISPEGDGPLAPKKSLKEILKHLIGNKVSYIISNSRHAIIFDFSEDEEYDDNP